MARISGIDLPIGKRIEIALTYIFGIGRAKAHSILTRAKVDFGTKVRDLTEDEVGRIRRVITSEETVEGDLRKNISLDIKRLMDIGCYRPGNAANARGAYSKGLCQAVRRKVIKRPGERRRWQGQAPHRSRQEEVRRGAHG